MSLVILQVPTMGAAYLAVSVLAEKSQSELYDMIPHGYGATLLVNSKRESVEEALKFAKVEFNIDAVLAEGEEKILRALYSIDNSALKEALLVVESISPGVLIDQGHRAVQSGLEIVDLKIPRGSQVIGSVLLTGSRSDIENFQMSPELKQSKAQVTLVPVTPALEAYFDISPKANN